MKHPHIFVQIEKNYLVWFSCTGKFFLLAPLAFDILQSINSGKKETISIQKIAIKYSLSEEKTKACYYDFQNRLKKTDKDKINPVEQAETCICSPSSFPENENVYYTLGEVSFLINYGTQRLKDIFHPLFSHLKSKSGKAKNCSIDLTEYNETFVLKNENKIFYYAETELHYLKGKIYSELYKHIYNLNSDDIMFTAHASVVTKNKTTLLLSGSGGSGKSTAAAILTTIGFQILTDDFALISKKGHVYGFPAAVTIKPGAVGTLKSNGFSIKNSNKVQYITVSPEKQFKAQSFPLRSIIFIRYRKNTVTRPRKLSFLEASARFFREIWINPNEKNIQHFFRWVKTVRFYDFEYSTNADLLNILKKLSQYI